jgi:hypothetical protein
MTQSFFLENLLKHFSWFRGFFPQGGSKISNKFFVPLNHTSQFRQGHKTYLHENRPCGRSRCYRTTSVSLLTVAGLGNKHWWCRSPTHPSLAAVRLVLFLLGTPSYIAPVIHTCRCRRWNFWQARIRGVICSKTVIMKIGNCSCMFVCWAMLYGVRDNVVRTAVVLNVRVLWVVTPCHWVSRYWYFDGLQCLDNEGSVRRLTRHHSPQDGIGVVWHCISVVSTHVMVKWWYDSVDYNCQNKIVW